MLKIISSPSKKRIFVFSAVVLTACIALTVFFTFFNVSDNLQESNMTISSVLTDDQAIEIALPNINQYTGENNRTIKTVNATFYNSTVTKGATWEVVALFDLVRGTGVQDWIDGYTVSIWAENGTVYYAEERGYYY
jgi:predicted PurR-regulated permease PerM